MTESGLSMKELIMDLATTGDEIAKRIGTRVLAKLPVGANAEAITDFERKRGMRFPPSYRHFLTLCNGWVNFLGTYTLIGVSGPHTERALREIDKELRKFLKKWHAKGRSTDAESVSTYESKGKKNAKTLESARLYLPGKLVFGIDSEGCMLLFDDRSARPDGEMEVLSTSPAGEITNRFADFTDMLRRYVAVNRRRVDFYRKLDEKEMKKSQKGKGSR